MKKLILFLLFLPLVASAQTVSIGDLNATWDDAAKTYNAVQMSVTSTGHAAGSSLFRLNKDGTPMFRVDDQGNIVSTGRTESSVANASGAVGHIFDTTNTLGDVLNAEALLSVQNAGVETVNIRSNAQIVGTTTFDYSLAGYVNTGVQDIGYTHGTNSFMPGFTFYQEGETLFGAIAFDGTADHPTQPVVHWITPSGQQTFIGGPSGGPEPMVWNIGQIGATAGSTTIQAYSAAIPNYGGALSNRDGHDMYIRGGDSYDSGAVDRDGGDLILMAGANSNSGASGTVTIKHTPYIWNGSPVIYGDNVTTEFPPDGMVVDQIWGPLLVPLWGPGILYNKHIRAHTGGIGSEGFISIKQNVDWAGILGGGSYPNLGEAEFTSYLKTESGPGAALGLLQEGIYAELELLSAPIDAPDRLPLVFRYSTPNLAFVNPGDPNGTSRILLGYGNKQNPTTHSIGAAAGNEQYNVATATTARHGDSLLVHGGDAYAPGAEDRDGGDLTLQAGSPANSGTGGVVKILNPEDDSDLVAVDVDGMTIGPWTLVPGLYEDLSYTVEPLGLTHAGNHDLGAYGYTSTGMVTRKSSLSGLGGIALQQGVSDVFRIEAYDVTADHPQSISLDMRITGYGRIGPVKDDGDFTLYFGDSGSSSSTVYLEPMDPRKVPFLESAPVDRGGHDLVISGGSAYDGTVETPDPQNGGHLHLDGGAAFAHGVPGNVYIEAGTQAQGTSPFSEADGADVFITATDGWGGVGNANGGDITLTPGASAGFGGDGNIFLDGNISNSVSGNIFFRNGSQDHGILIYDHHNPMVADGDIYTSIGGNGYVSTAGVAQFIIAPSSGNGGNGPGVSLIGDDIDTGHGGDIILTAGDTTGGPSRGGEVTITAGYGGTGPGTPAGGGVEITAGDATASGAAGGAVTITSGDGGSGSGSGGSIFLRAGGSAGYGDGGNIVLHPGGVDDYVSEVQFINPNTDALAGAISLWDEFYLYAEDGHDITIQGGSNSLGNANDVTIVGGASDSGNTPGDVFINGGRTLSTGAGDNGDVYITGGIGPGTTTPGDVYIRGGLGSGTGLIIMDNLPTSDPAVAGAVWNSAGFLKSTGTEGIDLVLNTTDIAVDGTAGSIFIAPGDSKGFASPAHIYIDFPSGGLGDPGLYVRDSNGDTQLEIGETGSITSFSNWVSGTEYAGIQLTGTMMRTRGQGGQPHAPFQIESGVANGVSEIGIILDAENIRTAGKIISFQSNDIEKAHITYDGYISADGGYTSPQGDATVLDSRDGISGDADAGNILIAGGDGYNVGIGQGGSIYTSAGRSWGTTPAAVVSLVGGIHSDGEDGGNVNITAGWSDDTGGAVDISGGVGKASGGNSNISGGDGSVNGDGGNVTIAPGAGAGAGANGLIIMTNLPTSDPAVAGALWNSSGTLMISSG